ncbi:MAG: FHA domain-containing protein [Methanobrevibacter sp.]|nr:FHA domain-containing protein [Methanobrevibacter sp.]
MTENENEYTEIIDFEDSNLISEKLAAINNDVRFAILEILRDFQKLNMNKDNTFKKDPYYSRELNDILLNKYNIEITPQMLGQHLKQLMNAGLIEEVPLKKEVPNKIGLRNVKAYVLKGDAFEELFLEINFISDELFGFFDLYNVNQKFYDEDHCILTIFNGVDKGKTFKVHKDETVLIGRKADFSPADLASFTILLDNSYTAVSNVGKPHLKLFYKDDNWCILDEGSTNGTFIGQNEVPTGRVTPLRKNSFLKLSRGEGGAVIYCSF